jgi:hypothetical protein
MIDESSLYRIASSNALATPQPDGCREDLIHALNLMLAGLEARRNRRPGDAGQSLEILEHWEDESYCYLEIELAARSVSGIDVNVSEGRAFIRLER